MVYNSKKWCTMRPMVHKCLYFLIPWCTNASQVVHTHAGTHISLLPVSIEQSWQYDLLRQSLAPSIFGQMKASQESTDYGRTVMPECPPNKDISTSRVRRRGNVFDSIHVSVCMCPSEPSAGWTIWHTDLKFRRQIKVHHISDRWVWRSRSKVTKVKNLEILVSRLASEQGQGHEGQGQRSQGSRS